MQCNGRGDGDFCANLIKCFLLISANRFLLILLGIPKGKLLTSRLRHDMYKYDKGKAIADPSATACVRASAVCQLCGDRTRYLSPSFSFQFGQELSYKYCFNAS